MPTSFKQFLFGRKMVTCYLVKYLTMRAALMPRANIEMSVLVKLREQQRRQSCHRSSSMDDVSSKA